MAREFLQSPDFKAPVLLNGSPGTSGQIPYSGGPSAPPAWGDPPGGGPGGGQTFTVSATAPVSPADGDEWLDTTTGIHYTRVNDGNSVAWVELGTPGASGPAGAQGAQGQIGEAGPYGPKSASLWYPVVGERLYLGRLTQSLEVDVIYAVIRGGTSVNFDVRFNTSYSAVGTLVNTNNILVDSTTTGITFLGPFSNNFINVGNHVWIDITAVSGAVSQLNITLNFLSFQF